MNRRFFLSSAIASVAALAIDPERLLWVPGKKLISIPAPSYGFSVDDFYMRYVELAAKRLAESVDTQVASTYISYDEGVEVSCAVLFSERDGLLTAIDEVHQKGRPLVFPEHWPLDRASRVTFSKNITIPEFRERYPDAGR